jgi:hypothetical protein
MISLLEQGKGPWAILLAESSQGSINKLKWIIYENM